MKTVRESVENVRTPCNVPLCMSSLENQHQIQFRQLFDYLNTAEYIENNP